MEISEFLDNNEKIIWQGKPVRIVYSLKGILLTFFGLFFLTPVCSISGAPLIFGSIFGLVTGTASGEPLAGLAGLGFSSFFACFTIPFWIVGLGLIFNPVIAYFTWKNVQYAITNKRVILSSGLIGQDFKSIDHDQIKNISVNVGLADKIFNKNTGTIKVFSGEIKRNNNGNYSVSDTMYAIENPYEIFKELKKVAHDIKTDIEYPNELRPDKNPGYNTEYKPDSGEKTKN